MSFDYPTETDAALLLDGLADVLELLPAHVEAGRDAFLIEARRRARVPTPRQAGPSARRSVI